MALVPSSSRGGGTFNGGTITTPLVIAPTDPAAIPLKITPAVGATAAFTYALQVYDDAGNILDYFDAAGEAGAEIKAGSGGAAAIRAANTTVFAVDEGSTRIDAALPAGWRFTIRDHAGAEVFRITEATRALGFYGATPTAQAAAIADAAGGAVQDTQARTALNSLLAAMRTLGLIAT